MALNPPPPPPRVTIQARVVRQVKDDARKLFTLLEKYAGKTKPQIVETNVAHYMKQLGEWLPKVIRARDLRGAIPTDWAHLQRQYENGRGSWKKCLPYARQLTEALQQCEE